MKNKKGQTQGLSFEVPCMRCSHWSLQEAQRQPCLTLPESRAEFWLGKKRIQLRQPCVHSSCKTSFSSRFILRFPWHVSTHLSTWVSELFSSILCLESWSLNSSQRCFPWHKKIQHKAAGEPSLSRKRGEARLLLYVPFDKDWRR